jgi:5-methyltetrahydropteroyltriglutamate--homocysteine methyltransferase
LQIGAAQPCRSLDHIKAKGFPSDKVLGAGIIDGRNVWAETGKASALLADIRAVVKGDLRVQVSP